MKKKRCILFLIFLVHASIFNSCRDDDEVIEIYVEGDPIPGIEISFPSTWHPDGQHIIYEHFKITKSSQTSNGILVEGVISFYKVNAEDAATVSNLKSF